MVQDGESKLPLTCDYPTGGYLSFGVVSGWSADQPRTTRRGGGPKSVPIAASIFTVQGGHVYAGLGCCGTLLRGWGVGWATGRDRDQEGWSWSVCAAYIVGHCASG